MELEIVNLLTKLHIKSGGILINEDIAGYVSKLYGTSTIFSIRENNKLSGFIAFYDNEIIKKEAYLTMLAVDEVHQGKGYGKKLLQFSIDILREKGFNSYKLEVLKRDLKVIKIYVEYGFKVSSINEKTQYMLKVL